MKKMPKRTEKYEVGYKKPPEHSQFKGGQSGNPKGRPKKSQTTKGIFENLARQKVAVTIDGKPKRVSMLEAAATMQFSKAIKGDPKASALIFKLLEPLENDHNDNLPELLNQFRNNYHKKSEK
jgi:hypothetical protein